MARTKDAIKNEILSYKNSRSELSILNSLSNTAIWRIWIFIQVQFIYTIELLFDDHRTSIELYMAKMRPHNALWYRNKILNFQYGQALVADSDIYDNTGLNDADIEAKKVVKYCAALEYVGKLILKVAGSDGTNINQLTTLQETALTEYIKEIKDAGVIVELINREADHYRCTIDVYYNAMVLDSEGNQLDGKADKPVHAAVKNYLVSLPFNGEYRNADLIDILQKVNGVVIPELKTSEYKYGSYDWTAINAKVTPYSGYMKIYDDADLNLNFIAYDA